jgi:hypothetical protein
MALRVSSDLFSLPRKIFFEERKKRKLAMESKKNSMKRLAMATSPITIYILQHEATRWARGSLALRCNLPALEVTLLFPLQESGAMWVKFRG